MISAEMIYQKAQKLSTFRLQELADYLDFLLMRDNLVSKKIQHYFPPPRSNTPMKNLSIRASL
jgi:hypothetical protein